MSRFTVVCDLAINQDLQASTASKVILAIVLTLYMTTCMQSLDLISMHSIMHGIENNFFFESMQHLNTP